MSEAKNDIRLFAPIEKVDKERMTVGGWATTEDIDKQSEIVGYEASKEAFADWPGNIREMHEPKAVGKAIEIIPDDDSRKVWVTAKVSKGAKDTWEKILDGTLTGFSIGGQTMNKTVKIVKDSGTKQDRQVTEITKYRLNELSLVDNPANPSCAFELVKRASDGLLYQTQIVEDLKKVLMVEVEDPLAKEVQIHREKADSLAKKVLDKDELQSLTESAWGVIRKYTKEDGTIVIEKRVPLPDKVHAFNTLDSIDGLGLSDIEKSEVHEKATAILGSAHNADKCLYCINGGDNEMPGEAIKLLKELAGTVTALVEKVVGLEKAYEGAHSPKPGAKETPTDADTNPKVGESAPSAPGAADDVETQKPEGAYPAKGPVKAADPATSDLETQPSKGAYPAKGPVKVTKTHDGDEKDDEDKSEETMKAIPDEGDLKTQEDPAAPVKKAKKSVDGQDDDNGTRKASNTLEKKDETNDKGDKDETQKSESPNRTEKVVRKLEERIQTLEKRLKEVDEKALPRKFTKVEKTFGGPETPESELAKEVEEVRAFVEVAKATGKPLTKEQEIKRDGVLNKMFSSKYDVRKVS